jgi:hypothetical protein
MRALKGFLVMMEFFRALFSDENRDFIRYFNLGMNSMRGILKIFFDRVPFHLLPEGKVTGHSGRKTM